MRYLLPVVFITALAAAFFWPRPVAPGPASIVAPPPAVPTPARPLALPDPGPVASNFPAGPPTPSARLVAEIMRLLAPGQPVDRDRVVNDQLPKLVAWDPAAATRLVEDLAPGPLREEMLRQLARLMSASDIHAALAWLARLPVKDQPAAAEAVIAQINQTDPAGAMGVAAAFGIGLGDGRQEHLMQLWTEQNPAAAVTWVMAQPAGLPRDRLVARTGHVRAQRDPAEAARLVLDHMSAGPSREEALMNVVRQWAVRDPVAAADWVKQFPHGPLLRRAQAELETARKLR